MHSQADGSSSPDLAELRRKPLAVCVRNGRRMDPGRGGARGGGQKRHPLWRAQPLVTVADIPMRADGVDVEVDVAGSMRAVDEHRDAAFAAPAHDVLHREDQRGRRGDVVDDDEPGALVERALDRVRHVGGGTKRHRDRHLDNLRAASPRDETQGVADSAVDVVGGDDPLPWREAQRTHHRVDSARRVLEEHRPFGGGPDEVRKRPGRLPDEAGQLVHEEPRGLGLHADPPLVLAFEELARRRSVGAVVEEHHVLFERPEMAQGAPVPTHRAAPAPSRAAAAREAAVAVHATERIDADRPSGGATGRDGGRRPAATDPRSGTRRPSPGRPRLATPGSLAHT